MVFHYWKTTNWEEPRWRLLSLLLKRMLLEEGYNGKSVREEGFSESPNDPYVEVEEGRVAIRRLTHLDENVQEELVKKGNHIYERVRRMQPSQINIKLREIFEEHNKIQRLHELMKSNSPKNRLEDLKSGNSNDEIKLMSIQDFFAKYRNLPIIGDAQIIGNNIPEIICDVCNSTIVQLTKQKESSDWAWNGYYIKDEDKDKKINVSNEDVYCDECIVRETVVNPILKESEDVEKLKESLKKLKETYENNKDNPNAMKNIGVMPSSVDNIEKVYDYYNVPPIDRLRNYQLLVNLLKNVPYAQKINEYFLKPIMESSEDKRKAYAIDDILAEKLMNRKNYPETLLPFPGIIIDCALPINNRFYFAFVCGRYFVNNPYIPYVGILTCYIEKTPNGGYLLQEQFLILEKDKQKKILDADERGNIEYNKKIRNFISGFLNFIHEPEVEIIEQAQNPKNNQRRIDNGKLPLPKFSIITITGKKKIYVDKHNKLPSSPKVFHFQQDVPAKYMHFRDKKRYKRLYDMDKDELEKKGYSIYNGIIRRKRMEFTRFKHLPRRNVSYIVEDESKNSIPVDKSKLEEVKNDGI